MRHALENALLIEEIGEDPVRWLILGPDRAGNLLELVVLDRPQGPAFIHAMTMRARYRRLLEGWTMTMATDHGSTADGSAISDVDVEELADEAERGYDVEELLQRRRGRPLMGSSAASVESVRLDPELKRDLLLRAAKEGTSVSDLIRAAVRQYLQAG